MTLQKFSLKAIDTIDWVTDIVLELALIIALLLGGYALWDSQQVYNAADSANYTAYHPSTDNTSNFDELRRMNPEIIAWLTVNDTNIDYPITHCDDNVKYVNTNAEGQYSLSGSIFLNCNNDPEFNDFNSILYGHHMEKKMMFGALSDFADKSYFASHRYGNLFYDGADHGIEFFALVLTDAFDADMFSPAIEDEEGRQAFIDYVRGHAAHLRGISLTPEDHLVLLSTCTNDVTNGRYILVGKITDETYLQDRSSNEGTRNFGTWDVQQLSRFERVPISVWIAIAVLLFGLLLIVERKIVL